MLAFIQWSVLWSSLMQQLESSGSSALIFIGEKKKKELFAAIMP